MSPVEQASPLVRKVVVVFFFFFFGTQLREIHLLQCFYFVVSLSLGLYLFKREIDHSSYLARTK